MKSIRHLSVILALLAATTAIRANEVPAGMPEFNEQIAKGNTFCNAGGYHCTGRFSEMLSHLYLNNDQDLNYVRPHDTLIAELNCSPLNGAFIPLYGSDKGSESIMNSLNLAFALNSKISLRIKEASDPCKLYYMRIYPD